MSIYYDGAVDFVGDMKDGAMLTVTGANQMSSYMDKNKLKDLRDRLINYLDADEPNWEEVAKSRMADIIGLTEHSDKLEEENKKLKSKLRVYKNVVGGVKDERLIPNEMLDLEEENLMLRDAFELFVNKTSSFLVMNGISPCEWASYRDAIKVLEKIK